MTQYQILRTDIKRIVQQTVRRIIDEILGVKGSNTTFIQNDSFLLALKNPIWGVINKEYIELHTRQFGLIS